MDFLVRRAAAEDGPAIARVQVAGWRTTYRGIVPEGYLAAMDEEEMGRRWRGMIEAGQSFTFVAEDGTEVVGFVSGGALRGRFWGFDSELYAIYLLEACKKQGLGRALVVRLAEELRTQGYWGMAVWALEANPAVGFYKRLGARVISGKVTEIGGARVPELALGWESLEGLGRLPGR